MDIVEIHRDAAWEWRWRRRAAGNNEIIATSGEGYVDQEHCWSMAERVNGTGCRYVLVGEDVTG